MPARQTRTTVSSRVLNQNTGHAKRAAQHGPVIITERGRPSHVLLTFEEYARLTGHGGSVIDLLGAPAGVEDAELDTPRLRDPDRPADFA